MAWLPSSGPEKLLAMWTKSDMKYWRRSKRATIWGYFMGIVWPEFPQFWKFENFTQKIKMISFYWFYYRIFDFLLKFWSFFSIFSTFLQKISQFQKMIWSLLLFHGKGVAWNSVTQPVVAGCSNVNVRLLIFIFAMID